MINIYAKNLGIGSSEGSKMNGISFSPETERRTSLPISRAEKSYPMQFYFSFNFLSRAHLVWCLVLLGCFGMSREGRGQTTVTYTQQTGNYYSTWTTGTAGAFNQGANQVGMFANGGGTKQVVSWRKFRTDGSGSSTSDRALQVGDRFVVTLSATRAFGKIGFALLASPGTGSWANRESNYAISFNMDGPGYGGGYTWYAKFNGGATSTGSNNVNGQQTTYKSFTFTLTLTAPDRMNASWTDGTTTSTLNDIQLNTSNPITDYSIFLEDDWDGGANRNIFWGLGAVANQHSVTNGGVLNHGQSNSSYTIGGVMFNGLNANSASSNTLNNTFNKSGTGNVTLNAANTYVGQTQIDNGELWIGSSGSIAAGSGILVGNGGQLTNVAKLWLSNATGGTTFSNNFTINNGNATTREIGGLNTSGTHTFSGNITNNSTTGGALLSTVNAGGSVTFSGVLSGAGAYTTQGAGTITFSGASANTYTGATTVNAGTLVLNKTAGVIAIPTATTVASGATLRTNAANQWGTGAVPLVTLNGTGTLNLNNNNQKIALASASSTAAVTLGSGTLNIDNTGTDTYAGVISGTGGVTKTNTGTQILSGTNTYTGTTTITGGILRLGAAGVIPDASNVVMNGGTLSTGAAAGFSETAGTLNLNANSTIALGTGIHTLTFANSSAVTWTGSLLTITGWTGANNGVGVGTAGRIFIGNSTAGLTSSQLSRIVFNISSVLYSAVQLSSGEIVASGAIPLYYGGATAAWNTTNWSTNNAAPYSTNWADGRHAIFNLTSTNLTGASVNFPYLTVNENLTISTIGGTIGTTGQNARIFVASGRTADFSTNSFSSAATFGITKNGPGILALAGNTYGGGFTLNEGLVVARGVNAMGGNATAGPLNINGGTIGANGTRDFSGKFSTINFNADFTLGSGLAPSSATSNFTFNANVALGSSVTRTLTLGGTGLYTWNGIISGTSSNFTIAGSSAASLTLGGINTFGGNFTMNASTATVILSAANTYGGTTNINNGTVRPTVSNAIPTGSALSFANTSGAILDLSTNALTHNISSLSNGGSNGGNIAFGAAATTTLTVNQSSNTTYSGLISGASLTTGGLIKTGSGTLTLGHTANTFTGTTTITAGELRLNPSTTTGAFASQMVLNGGKLSTTGIAVSTVFTSSSTLKLDANSSIDLGSNAHQLRFANSSAITWGAFTITVNGWTGSAGNPGTAGRIFVGSDATGLGVSQLPKINFAGYGSGALILSTGEIVPAAAPVSYTWTGATDGVWGTATNWSPNGVPGTIDNVTLNNGTSGALANLNLTTAVTVTNITFAGTASFFTVGSSGAVTALGNVTYTSGSGAWNCASTFTMSSSSLQTIPPFNYGNLNATGGNRTLPSSGTVGICGTFTRGAGTYTVTGSTVNYNGTGAQTIAVGTYNNLTISNARGSANLTSPAGTISVAGTFDVSGLSAYTPVVNASSIFDFTSASPQNIPAFFYGQLNNSGNGNRTWASSGNIDINQGFAPGSGTHTITGSTVRYSNTSGTTWNFSVFTTNFTSPARQYNNLIINGGAAIIWSLNGNTIGVAGNLTVTSGILQVGSSGGAGVLNVDGNITIDGANGLLNVSASVNPNSGTINLLGNFSISAGLFDKSGSATGTFNFAKAVSSPVQTISQTGGTITNNGTTWNLGTGSTPNVVEFTSNVTMSGGTVNANDQATVDFNTFLLTNGTFVANTGTTLVTSNTDATGALMTSTASGSVRSTTRTFTNAGVNYTFDGTSAQFTGNAIAAASNVGTLNLSNTSGANPALTFTSSPTVATALNVNNGINQLGASNITISATTASSVTGGSSTAFIQTNGAGRLIRAIATAGLPINYSFPIGTSTNYTPAAFNFTANAGAMNLIVGTVGSRNSNDVTPTDYINNRYWVTGLSGTPSTYAYTSVFTFLTAPTDVVGTIGNIRLNRFGGTTWTEDASSSASGSSLSSSSLTQATGSLSATAEWAGRVNPPFATYTWDGSANNGSWDDAANWDLNAVPSSASDVIIIPDVAPLAALAISGTRAVADFTVQTNGTFSMAASSQLTISGNYTYSSSTAATFNCSSTLILSSASPQTLPAANYGNLNLAGGARTLTSAATTRICGNYTPGTSTTAGTSIVEFNGTAAQAINTNAAVFATLTISNTADTISSNVNVTASTAFNVSTGASFNQASGTLTMTGATATINGTLRNLTTNNFVGGTITFTSTGVYEHRRNSGAIPTATWNTGSNCLITGTTTAVPSAGLGQSFSDFTWRTSLMSAGNNLSGALTSVRNLNIQTTNGQNLGLVATTAFTGTVSGNLNISGGNLILVTGANNNSIALNVSGNVSLSGAGSLVVSSGSGSGTVALNVTGTFTNSSTSSNSFTVNSGTKTVAVSATITGAYNHINTGTASVNTNSTATTVSLVANGGYTISSGTQNVANGGAATLTVGTGTTLTVNGGTLIGSATAHTGTINANGNVTVSSGTMTLANIASSTCNMTMANNNTMTISGSGIVNVAVAGTGNLNVGTSTTSLTTTALTINGGSLVLAGGGAGTINAYSDLNLTSGSISRSAGTANINFLKPGVDAVNRGTSLITQTSGTISGTIGINIGNGTLIYPLLVLGSSTINIGSSTTLTVTANGMIDCGASNVLTGGIFTLATQGTLVTANTAGITTGASGSIQTTTRNFGTFGYFIYNGSSAQVTGNAFPSQCAIFSVFNSASAGVTLTNPLTIFAGGQLILFLSPLGGILDLANNNLTLQTGATVVGASTTRYVRTSGTGRLIKSVSTSPVLFEVGNSTYNPVTLTPSSGTNIPYQVRVIDGVTTPAPNDGTKLINRYWNITAPTAPANTLTMNGQWATGNQNANYNAGTQVVVAYHNGTNWSQLNSTQAGAGPFTSSGAFALTASVINTGINFGIGKDNGFIGVFTWNGSASSSWTNQNNWTPVSAVGGPIATDNVVINVPGANTLDISSAITINDFDLSGTGTFTMGAAGVLTINGDISYSSSATPTLNCASTINIAKSTLQTIPAWNFGNLNATGGNRVLASSGTIRICGTFTRGAGAYTVTGSTVNYNGTGAQTISAGIYNNLTISNARGSANLTSPAGTIAVAGTFDVSSLSAYTPVVNAASIFDFTSAGSQSIPVFFYGQLNNSGNGARTWASSGIIDINQNFSPGSGLHTVTGSSVRYSNTAANTFVLASFTSSATPRHYNNLEIGGGASTNYNLASGFNLGCAGNFVYSGAGTFTVALNATANTMTVNGTATLSGTGTVRINNTASTPITGTLTVVGNTTISSGVLNNIGSTAADGNFGVFNTNDLTISGTGQHLLDVGSTTASATNTVNGTMSVTSTTANAVNFGSGGNNANNIYNLKGDLSKSGTGTFGCTGTFAPTSGFFFNLGSSSQAFSYAGAAMTVSNFTVAAGSTLQLSTNMVLGSNAFASTLTVAGTLNAGNFTVSPGNGANDFDLQATGTISTNSASGISGTISGFATAVPGFASGGTFIYTGTAVNTGLAAYSDITTLKQYTITWLGSTSLTLDASVNLNVFNFTNSGLVFMGNFDITLASTAGALTGSGFGSTKMFVTNGTGTLFRSFAGVGVGIPFTWPIGENTGTVEYSPVTVGNHTQTINGTLGFRVIDAIHPNNGFATSYLTRYWKTTFTGGLSGFTNATFTYDAGDVVGGPENASWKANSYNSTNAAWTQFAAGSSVASNTITFTSGAITSGVGQNIFTGDDITGRIYVPTYYRTVSGGSWSTPGIWEISSTPSFSSVSTPIAAPNNLNSDSIIIRSPHIVDVNSGVTADEVFVRSGGTLNITTLGTFSLVNGPGAIDMRNDGTMLVATPTTISSGAVLFVTSLLRQTVASQITATGTLRFGSTGSYEHNHNAGSIPTSTWDAGSTCILKNMTANAPSGLGQSFSNFTVDCPTLPGTGLNATGNLTSIGGNFTLISTNSSPFRLSSGANYALTVGGNLDLQANSQLDFSSGGGTSSVTVTGNVTMAATSLLQKTSIATITFDVNGNFIQSGGTFDVNNGSSGGGLTTNFRGDVTFNGTVQRSNGGSYIFNFVKASGTQTLSQGTPITTAQAIIWNFGNGVTTNTVQMLTDVNVGTSGTSDITLNNLATLDMADKVLLGANGDFTMGGTATLRLGSQYGITTAAAGATSGNIQTFVAGRTVNATGTFVYTGTVNQATGNLLPATLTGTGRITIANTGIAGNNTVTLTTNNTTTPQLNLSSGLFAIGSGNTMIIASGGTVNATSGDFATGATGGMVRFSTPSGGSFTGSCSPFSVETNGNPCGINFGTGTVTIQSGGVFNINTGGFVNTNAPAYASGSSLWYLTGGNYGRSLEWSTTSGKGYPHHVVVSSNTNMVPARTDNTYANVPFQCAGNLTINSGSSIYMDNNFGANNMTEDLRILGNFNLIGAFSLSRTAGSDLFIGGNWTNNGTGTNAFMTGVNAREVVFNGSGAQSMGGSNTTVPAFAFLAITKSSGDVTLNFGSTSSVTVNNRFQLNSGKLILGTHSLVLAPGCEAMGTGDENNYVVTNGTGVFRQQILNNASDFWFPVGPSTSNFGPVTLNQAGSGTTDNIDIRVRDIRALALPSYTNAVNDTSQMVKLEWFINEATAGGNSLRTTFGWQGSGTAGSGNIEGSGFDRNTANYHGHWNGTQYAVRATNTVSGSNPYFSRSTFAQPYTGNLNLPFVVGNINGILPCYQTSAAGDWNTASNWTANQIPPADAAVCINHAMTLSADPPNPSVVTIGSSGNLSIGSGVILTLEPGGTFTNNRPGFNMTSGTLKFQGGTSTINGAQPAGLYNLEINGNTTLTTVPTINNQMEIKPGGFIISGNGPVYGPSSTLIYNTGGNYNRSNEWRSTSGAGYPANVLVTGNTSLNLDAGTGVTRSIQGNMQIDNGSSVSQGATSFSLNVPGNFTLNGTYTQSTASGGDLVLGGNWTSGVSASLISNNRDVRFASATSGQTIQINNNLSFGYLSIDNTSTGVTLGSDVYANTFRVFAGRTFNLGSGRIIINTGGDVLINGTFNGGNGTIQFTDGGTFTNNGTFNRGTSTVDWLGNSTGSVVGTVQTNFHNLYLAPSSGVNFGSGATRGRISGVFQLRSGSYVSGNAPIYEAGSKLMYSGGGTFNRNVEWDAATLQKVEIRNNTTLKCGTNGTGFTHSMADSLIVQSGSAMDFSSPDVTTTSVVGGSVLLRGTLSLSNASGGDLRVAGDWNNDGGTFNCNGRLTTFDGSTTARLKGPSTTTFCFLTVNKSSGVSFTADAPVSVSRPPAGTELRVAGGILDLNGQSLTLGSGSNTLRVNEGDAAGQTLRTGGTSINGFNNYTDGTNAASLGGIVDFSGTSGETYPAGVSAFHQLWNSGSGNKTLPQSIVVRDDMKTEASVVVDFGASAFNIEVRGDLVHQGTTTGSGTGAVVINGSNTQNMSGNGTFRNLEINKTSNDVNSSGRPTITGKLNLISGKILQASAGDSITLGASATITETIGVNESFVKGKLSTTRVVGTAAENFGGMGISLTAGANLGTVVAVRNSGEVLTSAATGFTTIGRNWVITPSVQPSAADRNLTLSWPSEEDNLMNMNAIQLWKRSSVVAVWKVIGGLQDVSATNPRVATWTGVNSFSQFTAADLDNPLPLGLISFKGKNEKGNAVLTWEVSEYDRFTGYKVQKSEDGTAFYDLTFVTQGAEKSSVASHTYTDNTLRRNSYYKIGLVNKDGKTEWSQVVYIKVGDSNDMQMVLVPNPSADGTRLSLGGRFAGSEELQLSIFGTEGRNLGESRGKLDIINRDLPEMVKNLPKGIYQIRVISELETKTLRFMKD